MILVLNSGSSSLKACRIDPATGARTGELAVERIGAGGPADLGEAIAQVLRPARDLLLGAREPVAHA